MRRGRREDGGWREVAGVELAPATQPTPRHVRRTAGTSRALSRHCQRVRGPGGAADTGRLCAACAVTSHGGGKPATRPPSKPGPRVGLSLVSASRAARGAHRHATATTQGQPAGAGARGAHRQHADEPPAARPGCHCARRADRRLAAPHCSRPRRGSGQSASAARPRRATVTTRHDPRADHRLDAEGTP
jgi:hypothetical protein